LDEDTTPWTFGALLDLNARAGMKRSRDVEKTHVLGESTIKLFLLPRKSQENLGFPPQTPRSQSFKKLPVASWLVRRAEQPPIIHLIDCVASSSVRATNRASMDQLQNATSKVVPAFLRHIQSKDEQMMSDMFRQIPDCKHSETILEIDRRSQGLQRCFSQVEDANHRVIYR
jgi:hypothetical protein